MTPTSTGQEDGSVRRITKSMKNVFWRRNITWRRRVTPENRLFILSDYMLNTTLDYYRKLACYRTGGERLVRWRSWSAHPVLESFMITDIEISYDIQLATDGFYQLSKKSFRAPATATNRNWPVEKHQHWLARKGFKVLLLQTMPVNRFWSPVHRANPSYRRSVFVVQYWVRTNKDM